MPDKAGFCQPPPRPPLSMGRRLEGCSFLVAISRRRPSESGRGPGCRRAGLWRRSVRYGRGPGSGTPTGCHRHHGLEPVGTAPGPGKTRIGRPGEHGGDHFGFGSNSLKTRSKALYNGFIRRRFGCLGGLENLDLIVPQPNNT